MNKDIILSVDDEAIILMRLKQELKKDPFFANIQIEAADNGEEASKLLQEISDDGDKVPVIISDQRMPLMPGDEFLIRASELVPKTLKILLTGYSDLEAVLRLVNNNVLYRYLVKPWNRHDLSLTIKKACRTFPQLELIRLQASRIEHLTFAMVSALESANLFFDEDTGRHIMRIARVSAYITDKSGLPQECIHHIEMYAPLHDIGKVGVAKEILQKPSRWKPGSYPSPMYSMPWPANGSTSRLIHSAKH
ncbi:MAG: response regulator [Spirochaetes bacterium]|nr:response regulator [Spirochaetota bacterium]